MHQRWLQVVVLLALWACTTPREPLGSDAAGNSAGLVGWSAVTAAETPRYQWDDVRGSVVMEAAAPLAAGVSLTVLDYAALEPPSTGFVRVRLNDGADCFVRAEGLQFQMGPPQSKPNHKLWSCPLFRLDANARPTPIDSHSHASLSGLPLGEHHTQYLLPDGQVVYGSRYCQARCAQIEPLSAWSYSDELIREYPQANGNTDYLQQVRRAAAVAVQRIWNHPGSLTADVVKDALFTMHCNYTANAYQMGAYPEPNPQFWKLYNVAPAVVALLKNVVDPLQHALRDEFPIFTYARKVPAGQFPQEISQGKERRVYKTLLPNGIEPDRLHEMPISIFTPGFAGGEWTYHGFVSLHPNQHQAAFDRLAQLLQNIRFAQGQDLESAIAELAYISANMMPFGVRANWGVLYILVAQARRIQAGGSPDEPSVVDRQSMGLDWYMIVGAQTPDEAVAVYRAWSQGLIDGAYLGPQGDNLRRTH